MTTTNTRFQKFVATHPVADLFKTYLLMHRTSGLPLIALAVDMGQGGTKIAHAHEDGSGYTHYAVPSFFKEQRFGASQDLATGTSSARRRSARTTSAPYDEESYYITYDNRHFIYGRAAEDGGTTGLNNRKRYEEEQARVALMAAGASMLEKIHPGTTEAVVLVVSHVPQDSYSEEFANEIIKKNSGTYTFTLHTKDGEREYTLHILEMERLVEGTGAAILYGREDEALYAIADFGRGTSDFLLYRGIEAELDECFNENIGVSTIEGILNGLIEDKYKRKLTQAEMNQVLRTYVSLVTTYGYGIDDEKINKFAKIRTEIQKMMPTCHVLSGERRIQIDPITLYLSTRQACKAAAGHLMSIMRSRWGNGQGEIGTRLADFIFVGGMLYFIRPYLEKEFKGITIHPNYEYGNVFGLASRALSTVLFDLFKDEEQR